MTITRSLLAERHELIKPFIHKTPVLTSSYFNQITQSDIYFKCENFQKMGAFKMRGAASAMVILSEEQKSRGVVTHSSGNFAQAVSLAAKNMDIKAKIVMPENAPKVKKNAVRGYGGEIIESQSTAEAREKKAAEVIAETGGTFLHPSNDIDVIVGNATAAMELLEDYPDLDYILAPVGGGGLIAGCCLAAHHYGNNCKVIGAEPAEMDDAFRSLKEGTIIYNEPGKMTVADGLRTFLGDINFPIIQAFIDQILRVEEEEIVAALRMVWERMKIIIEPSCAVPVAAVLQYSVLFKGKKVGIILSGGNVDLDHLPFKPVT